MNVNDDLNLTAHLASEDFEWVSSPLAGVERVMLDRVGGEVAVATSLVRYAPGSYFDPHSHALGEEFLVLDGVFSDEHGNFPAGTYVRNPPGTAHRPHSEPGCTIFVKLRQFDDHDRESVKAQLPLVYAHEETRDLYRYGDEVVSVVQIPEGVRYAFDASFYVRELLVLSGAVSWQQEVTRTLKSWSWIRMAPGRPLRVVAAEPTVIFTKTRPVYRPAHTAA